MGFEKSRASMKKGSGDVEGHLGQERNGKETDCQRKASNGPTQQAGIL